MKKYIKLYKSLPIQVKASFWFLICSFMQKGISTITTPIFTRIFSVSEYGQYSVFNSWLQIITPIVCLNLFSGVYSQGIVKFEEDRNRFSSSLQGLTVVLLAVWGIIYCITSSFWNHVLSLTTIQMVAMFIMIWTSATFSFWSMDQRVDFKYQKLVALTIISSVLQPIVSIVFMICSEDKVTARILGMTLVQIVLYSGTFVYQMIKGKQFFSKQYWWYALKFNIPLLPHYLSLTLLSSSDRIMIGRMIGDEQAGIYNLAYSVSLIMTMFNTALLQTIEPWIYRKLKENNPKDIADVAYPSFMIIAFVNILLIMFSPEVIAIFAPKEYQQAIWIIPSVALSVFFMFLYTFFATFEFYYEKTNYIAFATVTGALLNIVLNYIFIKMFGYMAAGYTTLFSYMLFAVMHYYFMSKICRQYLGNIHPYNSKIIIGISICSLVVGFGFMITYSNIILRYIVILVFLIFAIIMRKKIKDVIGMLINLKKKK